MLFIAYFIGVMCGVLGSALGLIVFVTLSGRANRQSSIINTVKAPDINPHNEADQLTAPGGQG